MRIKIVVVSLILIWLLVNYKYFDFDINKSNLNSRYKIITTSFQGDGTTILKYENNRLISSDYLNINEVKNTYNNGNLLMGTGIGELVDFTKSYRPIDIYPFATDYLRYDNSAYILHKDGTGFTIKKYSGSYEVELSSEKIKGLPRNFVVYDDLIYVLANTDSKKIIIM